MKKVLSEIGGFMKRYIVILLSLFVGSVFVNTLSAAERVVVCEELYQEG